MKYKGLIIRLTLPLVLVLMLAMAGTAAADHDVDYMCFFGTDSDSDGICDHDEVTVFLTDPFDSDTDGDGLYDGFDEVFGIGTDPLNPDTDSDGLDDGDEFSYGADPLNPDTDSDGLLDGEEVWDWGANPSNFDTDGDGLPDGGEVWDWGTDPSDPDTDGDGLDDWDEVLNGTNPLDPNDPPSNQPPVVTAGNALITVNEGDIASNTGTVGDPDGDPVTLSASSGTVTNNNDGTWSWSFPTSDGPAESQSVTISANDGNGGTAQTSFNLTVNNVAPTVDAITIPAEPIDINEQPVTGVSATFSDPALNADSYTCTVDYADGTGPKAGTVTTGTSTCDGPAQTYANPGVYAVTVTVTDEDGGSGSATATEFIVIYDPSGGFVTGGGWIDSPVNTEYQYMQAGGKATFGFVSKYQKGANVPEGNTQFQFKAGDLNFHSTRYEWLVVAGNKAQFRGEGTINGEGSYNFMISADDDSPDTFRIKIWDYTETVLYDNGSQQALGGGSIKVHNG